MEFRMPYYSKAISAVLVLIGLVLGQPQLFAAEPIQRPNILVIVLDDVGYSDLGSYGSEIATPSFDALADGGLRYSNFHATPSCSPSRAALLTGREAHRVGMGLVTEYDLGPTMPAFRGRITPQAATLAQLLQKQDYGTYAIGKWHLAPPSHQNAAGPFMHWPLGKGFDRFYGFLAGSTDQFRPGLMRDNTIIDVEYPAGEVLTTDLVNNAISYIADHTSQAPERPFMMYLSLPGMHAPHQASDEYLKKYRGKYAKGWDDIRTERFQRQKDTGLVPADSKLGSFNRGVEHWNDLDDDARKVYARFQEVYAGFLEQTDAEVGRVMSALDTLGQRDNTIVMVLSDNGGSSSGYWHGSANPSTWYNGVRETMEDNLAVLENIGRPGSGPNYPRGWAQASNTPFPFYKTQTYGGGINVPLVVNWPAGLAARGETRHQYHHISDIMPTLAELVDFEIPQSFAGIEQLPTDGISMAYTFGSDSEPSRRTTQFYRMGDQRGIYLNGWAAASRHRAGTALESDTWSLFDRANDFSESTDLAGKHPEKLEELKLLWQREAQRLGADQMLEPLLAANGGEPPRPDISLQHTFYPGSPNLPEKSTPKVMGRSFAVDVPVHSVEAGTQGVLVAHGNSHSGYVLYVQDKHLVVEYNYLSNVASKGRQYKLVSEEPVPIGSSRLGFKLKKNAAKGARLMLTIDGEAMAHTTMSAILMKRISHEGLDVGLDRYNQVGHGYTGPYPFTADIESVNYVIEEK